MLIAMKTDGGGIPGAKGYLKGKVESDKWIIASDAGAVFYKKVTGSNSLYGYAVFGPDGDIAETGSAGRYYNQGNKKTFTLAKDDISEKFGKSAVVLLPADKEYDPSLNKVVELAELGFYKKAFLECMKLAKKPDLKDKALELRKDIISALENRLAKLIETVKNADAQDRFKAYMELRELFQTFKKENFIKQAKSVLKEVSRDPAIKKELSAEKSYLSLMKQVFRMSDEKKAVHLSPVLRKFINKHAGTLYAGFAEEEIQRLQDL